MCSDNLRRLRAIVFQDASLQRKLFKAASPKAFLREVQQAASERGCDVSTEDVLAAMADTRRAWVGRWR